MSERLASRRKLSLSDISSGNMRLSLNTLGTGESAVSTSTSTGRPPLHIQFEECRSLPPRACISAQALPKRR